VIPQQAVWDNRGMTCVFVVEASRTGPPGTVVRQREVKLGQLEGEQYEVLAGLRKGEKLALGDLSKLRDGARCKVEGEPEAAPQPPGLPAAPAPGAAKPSQGPPGKPAAGEGAAHS
jgi:hypothetical protein